MAKKKITVEGITKSDIEIVGGDRLRNVPPGMQIERGEHDDVEIRVAELEEIFAKVIGGDEIEFSDTKFHAALSSVENVLSVALEAKHAEEMHRIMAQIRQEKSKANPDWNKIRQWLDRILKLVSLAKLAKPVAEQAQSLIRAVAAMLGLG